MTAFKDRAVVLRRLDYSETSQVLAVFTREHGQQRLIAKGIKRSTKTRVAVGIDLLELGGVVFSRRPGKEDVLGILMEWRQEDSFPHLRRDLARCYAAQYAADVTASLTEVHDPHPALFDALVALLGGLRDGSALASLDRFLWALLGEIGLGPDLERCMSCARPVAGDRHLYFSSREGGAICRDCEPAAIEKFRVDAAALGFLLASREPTASGAIAPPPADTVIRSAFDLLDYHLTQTLGRPSRLSAPLRLTLTPVRPRR